MLKALECRYEEDIKLTSGSSQLPVCTLADSEFDVASSSTSCADSGRGLSCEVHDEPAKTPAAPGRGLEPSGRSLEPTGRNTKPLEPLGRGTEPPGQEPLGRGLETFRRGTEVVGRSPADASACRSNTLVTVADGLLASSAAQSACRQLPSSLRSTVNVVGSCAGV